MYGLIFISRLLQFLEFLKLLVLLMGPTGRTILAGVNDVELIFEIVIGGRSSWSIKKSTESLIILPSDDLTCSCFLLPSIDISCLTTSS